MDILLLIKVTKTIHLIPWVYFQHCNLCVICHILFYVRNHQAPEATESEMVNEGAAYLSIPSILDNETPLLESSVDSVG